MHLNEQELITALRNDDEKTVAFNRVVKLYQQQLYWSIRKMVLCHDDTNDVLQNTFIKAWNSIDNFRGDSKLLTWLYRIAINETLGFLRKQRSENTISLDDEENFLAQKMEADEFFDGDELQLKLQKAVLSLPEKQRIVFNMKYFEEMKYEEMEAVLGTSVGALKASYHLAVKKIEAFINKE
ncbi:MAG: sigma-70 family RNA polymerase sigma factor [Prevotellaceae bacterium]|jgi:RNA polymerase sigma-70 factor (ECF subfamily)|nr:sigma-70 family RNA polymerase sigma factor [Prevotellaceae bacterium]